MKPDELKSLMESAGIPTQRALAVLLDKDKATVWRWMKGTTPIGAANAALIREKLKAKPKRK